MESVPQTEPLTRRATVTMAEARTATTSTDRETISAGIRLIADAVVGRTSDDNVGEYDDLKESDPGRTIPADYRAPPPPPPPLRPELNHQAPVSRKTIRETVGPHRPVEKDTIHIHQVAGILVSRFAPDGFQRVAITPHRDGHITSVFYGLDSKGATWKETITSPRRVYDRATSALEPVEKLVARVCTLVYAMISRYDGREEVPVQLHDPSRERSTIQRATLGALQDFLRGPQDES